MGKNEKKLFIELRGFFLFLAAIVGAIAFGWLVSGCSAVLPPSASEFRRASGEARELAEAALIEARAARQDVGALRDSTSANFAVANQNFQTLAAGVEQATKRAEAAKNLGETTVKLLGPIGKNAVAASKEATAGRKAAEAASQKIVEAQKALGEKIDSGIATTGAAVADVGRKVDSAKAAADTSFTVIDQKIDRRTGEVIGEVRTVGTKVDVAKTAAETAGSKADAAGAKAEAAGSRAEAAAAKAGADTTVEVGKVRKELSDHAVEAERARQDIMRLLGMLGGGVPPPAAGPAAPAISPPSPFAAPAASTGP